MKIFIVLPLFCFSFAASAQVLEEKIVASLDSFSLANPQEKVYLQTDRSRYLAGESIWFKAYCTLFEKPGILSKVVYVTLSDAKGTVIEKKQLQLKNATAAGEFGLAPTMASGNYTLSAYTLWMLNFPGFIDRKTITVYNTQKNEAVIGASSVSTQVNMQFFPESGKLVNGISSKIAFRALDQWNRPIAISGNILDSKNNIVDKLTTSHAGLGMITLIPAPGETYHALVTENGRPKRVMLPVPLQEGVVLSADNSNEGKTFVKLERGEKNKEAYNNLLLVAQQNYQVVYMAKINFDEGQDAVAINKKKLSPGIMQITVFSNDGKVLGTRAVFVGGYEKMPALSAVVDNGKRKKSSITVDLSEFGEPDIAAAVINSAADSFSRATNIRSALLLASDLGSAAYEPAYYLRSNDSLTRQHLDILMMTAGWARFDWAHVLASRYPALKYPFETSLSISGKVLKIDGKSPLAAGKINLIIKGEDSTTILSEATVNSRSEFVVSDVVFRKLATVYYQGANKDKSKAMVSVKMNEAYFDTLKLLTPQNSEPGAADMYISGYMQNLLSKKEQEDNARSKLLQEVVVVSKKISAVDSVNKLYVSPFFEYSDQTLIMDDGHYFDIWQYLQRSVPGISIDRTEGTPLINFTRYDGLNFFSSDGAVSGVQLYLNEVPVSPEIADALNPSDISVVKVYKGGSGVTLGATRGAIGIYTKKGVSNRDWRVKGFDFIKKGGYSVNRDFYQMDYSLLNPESSFTDVRPTLYWNPYVKVANGKAVIEYYNDDINVRPMIILEGIDKAGKLILVEQLIR
jgi:hypothetical protein